MDDNKVTYFAETDSRNKRVSFGIKAKDRLKHLYTIGKTGMGKSTMLENMAIQDIRNGEGIAFIDPHGKTADLLLDYIPEERIKDVIYFAPFDTDFPISFNVMEDVGEARRHLVVSGLMSTFEKIWADQWSARMAYILQNTLSALLEYPGATMLGINRMLIDKIYRGKIVENVKDASVKAFWIEEFAKYTERFAAEATPAIQNKVGQFVNNPLVRNIIGQPKSSFDMRKAMDEKKILIVNLSKGLVGENNANLIGSMLITKIYLSAMSRSDVSEAELKKLPNFYLYVDEFQSFANKSFADILSEARKYKLALNIAHQYIEQMEEEVRAAVFGNVGTMISFRVGSFDAEVLEKEFAPIFTAEDIVNLGAYQMYLKLMIDGVASQPFSATGMAPIPKPEISFRTEVLNESRSKYAEPKERVELAVKEWYLPVTLQTQTAPKNSNKSAKTDTVKEITPTPPHVVVENHNHTRQETREVSPLHQPVNGLEKKPNILGKAIEEAMKGNHISGKENIQNNKPEVVKEASNEPAKKDSIPLSVLAQDNRKKDKGPTEKNKNALREVLQKVSNNHPVMFETQKSKEVPEDVLRKVLKGE